MTVEGKDLNMRIETPNGVLEGDTIAEIIEKHGKDCLQGTDMQGADLRYADLRHADLRYANLRHAALCYANLRYADLRHADLRYANLRHADLRYANLRNANLYCADLQDANLHYADLCDADLCDANLCDADMRHADLSHADMRHADLSHADLRDAAMRHADLSHADMRHADLHEANLCGVDLRGANLYGADLQGADLRYASLYDANFDGVRNIPPSVIAKTSILPDEGDVIGWKQARDVNSAPVIVKLLIPADARRSNATTRKCRASKAKVLDIQNLGGESLDGVTANSKYDVDFIYRKGETVKVSDFDMNRWNECAPGIHFFITRQEAVEY